MTNTGSRRHVGLMLGLMLGHAAPGITAAGPDGEFRIMSDEEIAAHREAMATLEGAAREEYRNTQYQELRARAERHGFSLPDTPPWATTAAPAPMPSDTAAEHAAMRDKLAAHKAQAGHTAPGETAAPAADPARDDTRAAASMQPQPVDGPPPSVPMTAPAPIAREDAAVAAPAAVEAPAANVDAAPPPVALPPPVPAPTAATVPTARPQPPAPPAASAPPPAAGYSDEAMAAYREEMRARFDSYLKQRQAQQQEAIRRQREHIEASRDINRNRMPAYNRPAPPPYPPAPGYGPRYPAAFPGYRTPYWQQPE